MPEVSVVVPVFNRIQLLERTLKSVLAQTLSDIEIIIVDDGSAEDVGAVLSGFDDARLRLLRHEENKGAGAARNTGVAAAKGNYIAFLDSDDEWEPDKLERQLARFAEAGDEVGVVSTWVRIMPPDRPVEEHHHRGDLHDLLLTRNVIGTTSAPMIRKRALDAIGGFDERLPSCQDWDLWIRLSEGCRFDLVEVPLTIHNRHADTITRSGKASVEGHRLFAHKHASAVARLPRPMRSAHFMTLGEAYLWKRAYRDAGICFAKGIWLDPRAMKLLMRFALRRLAKRL